MRDLVVTGLRCRPWTEAEFRARRADWNGLLARSDADPLFSSWEWNHCWWRQHAAALGGEPCVLAIETARGQLAGIAPFYSHESSHGGLFRTRRLELIGNAWRRGAVIFSEYLDVIADRELRADVVASLHDYLGSGAWSELVFCNVRDGSVAGELVRGAAPAYARRADTMTAWTVELPQRFDDFVAGLDSNTRRKLFHQRAKLVQAHCVELPHEQWPDALARLERLVAARWRHAADPQVTAFHAALLDVLDPAVVRFTELRSGSRAVSLMLNLRAGQTEYYLQSGFDPEFARGLSPGYLHLGFAIEAACRDGLRRFDLMAGRGLHRDYKRDLAAQERRIATLHVVRHRALALLFRMADRVRGRTDITSPE